MQNAYTSLTRLQLVAELKARRTAGATLSTKLSGKGVTNAVLRAELERLDAEELASVTLESLDSCPSALAAAAIDVAAEAVAEGSVQAIVATFCELYALCITLLTLAFVALPQAIVRDCTFVVTGWFWPIRFITAIVVKHPITRAAIAWVANNWEPMGDRIFCLN
ncbi:MAG: hypothetical protein AAFY15_05360 [Cyanobacteria bacterium J06648_11]